MAELSFKSAFELAANISTSKQSGNAASGPRRDWFRSGLVAAQAGFSMILLIGGALYGRTLWNAYSTDLGFRSSNVLTAAFSLPMSGGDSAERMRPVPWQCGQATTSRLCPFSLMRR